MRSLDIDTARLLPRFRARSPLLERARMVEEQAAVLREAVAESSEALHLAPGRAGGDPRTLRGIPVIARAVGGVSPGTQPEAETIRRSEGPTA